MGEHERAGPTDPDPDPDPAATPEPEPGAADPPPPPPPETGHDPELESALTEAGIDGPLADELRLEPGLTAADLRRRTTLDRPRGKGPVLIGRNTLREVRARRAAVLRQARSREADLLAGRERRLADEAARRQAEASWATIDADLGSVDPDELRVMAQRVAASVPLFQAADPLRDRGLRAAIHRRFFQPLPDGGATPGATPGADNERADGAPVGSFKQTLDAGPGCGPLHPITAGPVRSRGGPGFLP